MKFLFCLFIIAYSTPTKASTRHYENELSNMVVEKYEKRYVADWRDLDTRPLPEWYDKAKIGIFLHWGVFSVPSFKSEWFWNYWIQGKNNACIAFMEKNYPPGFTYQEFAPMFTAEFFEPKDWAKLFADAGAKYVVLTSKHHEGFTLFPSKRSFSWNSVDIGPKRDLVGDLSKAVLEENMKFGVYHSLYEWFNPIYLEDKKANFKTKTYTNTKLWPDLMQLVNDYHISVLWSDGDWEAKDEYWRSKEFLAWLYNDSPVRDDIVVNDRWGIGIPCHHGDFFNCADRYNPGQLQNHKWENAFTLDRKSWGYRRNLNIMDVLSTEDILREIVSTISCGGNALINVGPTKEGTISPIFQERLLTLGRWLKINGEAIYETSPWIYQNDTSANDVWYTCRKMSYNARRPTAVPNQRDTVTAIYAIVLKWPTTNILSLHKIPKANYAIELLGNKNMSIKGQFSDGIFRINLPDKAAVTSQYAWTLKLTSM